MRPVEYCRREVLGLEPYSSGKTTEEAERESGLTDIVKMASNENPYGPSPRAIEALVAEVNLVRMYPWNRFTDLKGAIAQFVGVEVGNVVVGHGSEAVMQLIPMLFVRPGDEAIVPQTTYSRYAEVSKVMGATVVIAPMVDYAIDVGEVIAAMSDRTRLVWLCSPNNPTGTIITQEQVEAVLAALPKELILVLDQAYQEYATLKAACDGASLIRAGCDNLIVLRTFSKAYGLAGVRLGYGLASEEICTLLDTIKEPFNLSRLAAAAGPAALRDAPWLAQCIGANAQQRSWLEKQFLVRGLIPVPSQSNFVLVNVGLDAEHLFRDLMARGVLVRPGTAWGYRNHIRVTVGTPEQNRRFLEALDAVLAISDSDNARQHSAPNGDECRTK